MKAPSILTILFALPFALASCSKDAAETAADPIADAAEAYPLTTCVVSGEELGSMGDPIVYDHEGTTVKFCCKSCVPEFEKEPAKYLTKLQQ